MYIAATNTRLCDANTNVPGVLECKNWSFLEGDLFHGAEDKRGVGILDQLSQSACLSYVSEMRATHRHIGSR